MEHPVIPIMRRVCETHDSENDALNGYTIVQWEFFNFIKNANKQEADVQTACKLVTFAETQVVQASSLSDQEKESLSEQIIFKYRALYDIYK